MARRRRSNPPEEFEGQNRMRRVITIGTIVSAVAWAAVLIARWRKAKQASPSPTPYIGK